MDFFADNWLSILVIVYLVAMMLYGHYRGFVRLSVSAAALVITLIAVKVTLPYVTDYLRNNTELQTMLEQRMESAIGVNDYSETEVPAEQRQIIEGLELPEQLKKSLIENNNSDVYKMLGVDKFTAYIGSYLADTIFSIIGFILLFLLIWILLHALINWIDLITKLPILSGINKIAGACLGLFEGIIYIWIVFLFITVFAGTKWGMAIISEIERVPWLAFMYRFNLLGKFVVGIIGSIF